MTIAPALSIVELRPRDVPMIRIALPLLKATIKSCWKTSALLGLSVEPLDRLKADQDAIEQTLNAWSDDQTTFCLPTHLARTTRIAVGLEYDKVAKLKDGQGDLLIEDDATKARLSHLDQLLAELDEQGSLTFSFSLIPDDEN